MTLDTSRRVIEMIEAMQKLHPTWRIGQLVANVAVWAKGASETAVWEVEDAEFIRAAEAHIAHSSNP